MVTVEFKGGLPFFRALSREWEEMGGYKGFLKSYCISISMIKEVRHEVLPATDYPQTEWEG